MRALCPILLLAAVACSRSSGVANEAALYNDSVVALDPTTQPVTIGENGASFPACATRGETINLSPDGEATLPVRRAPFAEADAIARLGPGSRVFLCTRSMDQRWQGVVIPPDDRPDADCGVAAPVAAAQPYAGPCRSGWVASSFVQVSDRQVGAGATPSPGDDAAPGSASAPRPATTPAATGSPSRPR